MRVYIVKFIFVLYFSSIGVFLYEQTIDSPIITGLSVYKQISDNLNDEENLNLLRSTNLSIICPQITNLTSITLALANMLKSDSLINLILSVIRKNILNKKMNTDHSIVSNNLFWRNV